MGAAAYSSGMCLDCYKEYLENAGGQLAGHNPPAYTMGLIKASKAQVQHTQTPRRNDTLDRHCPMVQCSAVDRQHDARRLALRCGAVQENKPLMLRCCWD